MGANTERPVEPGAFDRVEAAAFLGIGVRTLDRLTKCGGVPHVRFGARVIYPVAELRAWLSARVTGGGLDGRGTPEVGSRSTEGR